jgi:nucleotide-binding universal stress UspA family protein
VVVLHVTPPEDSLPEVKTVEADSQARLEGEVEWLRAGLRRRQRADATARALLRAGTPSVEIADVARQELADLVIVGRRGAGRLRGLFLGSTAERLAHELRAPLLIVGTPAQGPYAAPILALAPDVSSRSIVDAAVTVAAQGERLLEVVSAVSVPLEGWLWGGWTTSKEILRIRALTREHAREELGRILDPHRARGLKFRVALNEGDPRQVIPSLVNRRKGDLLVLGTETRGGMLRFRLGSVAAHVIRNARCDVLIAHPPQPGEPR